MSSIAARAQELGFGSLSEYLRQRPRTSLVALAAELRNDALNENAIDTSSPVLEHAKGDGKIERCARDLLVRALHQHLAGWPAPGDPEAREALGACLLAWATLDRRAPPRAPPGRARHRAGAARGAATGRVAAVGRPRSVDDQRVRASPVLTPHLRRFFLRPRGREGPLSSHV